MWAGRYVGLACLLPLTHHGHRNGWGMFTRHPALGIEFSAYQKLWRAVGVDHLHVNGLQNKFWEPDDSVVQSIQSMQQPLWERLPRALPVISSGQWGGQAPETISPHRFQIYSTSPVAPSLLIHWGPLLACALFGMPASAVEGLSLEEAAAPSEELRLSIQKFGQRS